ncbi:MAG: hypothetical protein PVJ19_11890 [Desulfobacteraceae bacterium]
MPGKRLFAFYLFFYGDVADTTGQIGVSPGSKWGSGNTSTKDNSLIRNASVCSGSQEASDTFDPDHAKVV